MSRFGILDRLRGLDRHVVLVVLRQHQLRMKHSVGADLALSHAAAAFLEQIGQDAGIDDRNAVDGIGDREVRGQSVCAAPEAALFDEAADAEAPRDGRFARDDLRRAEEEHQILVERAEREPNRRGQAAQSQDDKRDPLVTWFHVCTCRASNAVALVSSRRALRRRSRRSTSPPMATSVSAYEPHT